MVLSISSSVHHAVLQEVDTMVLQAAISTGLLFIKVKSRLSFEHVINAWSSELGRELATYSHTPKALGHAVIFMN